MKTKDYTVTDETVEDWNTLFASLSVIRSLESEMISHLNNYHHLQSDTFQDMKQYCKKVVMDIRVIEMKETV